MIGDGRTLEVMIERSFRRRGYDVFLAFGRGRSSEKLGVVTDFAIEERDRDSFAPMEPVLSLTNEELQGLMDELWRAGVRPSDDEGNVGALAATKKHLDDMRKLIFEGTLRNA